MVGERDPGSSHTLGRPAHGTTLPHPVLPSWQCRGGLTAASRSICGLTLLPASVQRLFAQRKRALQHIYDHIEPRVPVQLDCALIQIRNTLNITSCNDTLLLFENLKSSDETFQTKEVVSVSRNIYFIENDIRYALCLSIALLFAYYFLLGSLKHNNIIYWNTTRKNVLQKTTTLYVRGKKMNVLDMLSYASKQFLQGHTPN